MEILRTVFSLMIVLGVIVLVHEFGHYIAARLTGVRVEVFSFGFGKRLFGKKIGETDFRFSLIPLGGYVKMAGEEEYDPDNLKPYEFQAKNRGQKIFILLMGSVMNVILAFVIFSVTFMTGVKVAAYKYEPPRIGYVEKGSPAEQAGIRKGDLILTIEGRDIKNWEDLEIAIGSNPDLGVPVEYKRDGEILNTTLDVKSITRFNIGDAGIYWDFKAKIADVNKDSPAEKAGLQKGDLITAIDGQPLTIYETFDKIGGNAEIPLNLTIKRGNDELHKSIIPKKYYFLKGEKVETLKEAEQRLKEIKKLEPQLNLTFSIIRDDGQYRVQSQTTETLPDETVYGDRLTLAERGIIGAELRVYSPTIDINYGLVHAMKSSVEKMVNLIDLVFRTIGKLIEGKLSHKNVSSLIDIAEVSREAMESGATNYFILIAFISLQLGLINLLPIPALDGGHLMIYTIEAVIRKELSMKVKNVLINMGFIILMALMVFLLLNDIAKRLPNGWESLWPF